MSLDKEDTTPPNIMATAEFTKDMVETLRDYFDRYAVEGAVTVEVTDRGLWLRNPNGGQQFLGSAHVFPNESKRLMN